MAKLSYTKLRSGGKGRYDLMVDAKVKELIDFYEISMLLTFITEWEEWRAGIAQKNAFSFQNAYRLKVENGVCQIWRHFADLHIDPILIYEIREVASECQGNCGMNYCDDNGCLDRKRELVEPIDAQGKEEPNA